MPELNRAHLMALSIVALTACESAVAPNDRSLTLAPLYAALQERGSGVISVYDFIDPGVVECVGEPLSFTFEIPHVYGVTVTPTGALVYRNHFVTHEAVGSAVGVTTGTVWTLKTIVSPEVLQAATGSAHTYTGTSQWASETVGTVQFHFRFHLSQNADGVVVVDRFENSCRLL